MDNLFKITGIIVWILLSPIVFLFVFRVFWDTLLGPAYHIIANLRFAACGSRNLAGHYVEVWQKCYAHDSDAREYWKQWNRLRRVAYIRFLRETKRELHIEIDQGKTY